MSMTVYHQHSTDLAICVTSGLPHSYPSYALPLSPSWIKIKIWAFFKTCSKSVGGWFSFCIVNKNLNTMNIWLALLQLMKSHKHKKNLMTSWMEPYNTVTTSVLRTYSITKLLIVLNSRQAAWSSFHQHFGSKVT